MKQDDQRNKIILLVILAVALVGYVAYTAVSSGNNNAQAVNKPEDSQREIEEAAATEDIDASQAMAAGVFPEIASPSPRRDPFSISVEEARASQAQSQTPQTNQATARVSAPVANSVPNPFKGVSPFRIVGDGMGDAMPLPAVPQQQAPPPSMPKPKPVLTGVVIGPQTLAIIQYADKSHVVEEGKSFAGKYRLVSVSKESVTLQDGSKQIRLGLGG